MENERPNEVSTGNVMMPMGDVIVFVDIAPNTWELPANYPGDNLVNSPKF